MTTTSTWEWTSNEKLPGPVQLHHRIHGRRGDVPVTEAGAKSAILTSALVTGGSTVARSMLPDDLGGRGELPSARALIGTAVAFTALSIFASFAPTFAGAWAILIGVIALLDNGAPILDKFLNAK